MKRVLMLMLTFMLCLAGVSEAREITLLGKSSKIKTGILIIDGSKSPGVSDYYTEAYYKAAEEIFLNEDSQRIAGTQEDINEKYREYCTEKGIWKLSKIDELTEFTKKSGYDNVICFVLKSYIEEFQVKDSIGSALNALAKSGGTMYNQATKVTMQTNAFLCDGEKLLKAYSTIQGDRAVENRMAGNREKRAYKGAFTKCAKEIQKGFFAPDEKRAKKDDRKKIGAVIIGDSDYRTKDYFKHVKDRIKPKNKAEYVLEVGDDVQGKYTAYWAKMGFMEEQPISGDEAMTGFAKEYGYEKVIFLIAEDITLETDTTPSFAKLIIAGIDTNATGSVHAVLCDQKDIVTAYTATGYDRQWNNYNEREMRRNVFKYCVKEIGKAWAEKL